MWKLGDQIPGFGLATKGHMYGGEFETIRVTSGANSGSGTFRDAVENRSGPRLIEFDPDIRDIQLSNDIDLRGEHITINGHSAGGVQVRGATFKSRASDTIHLGMKYRLGKTSGEEDSFSLNGGEKPIRNNALIHCNFQWGTDECIEVWQDVKDFTFYVCMISEGLNFANHGYGMLISGRDKRPERGSLINSLYAFNQRRSPRSGDGPRS